MIPAIRAILLNNTQLSALVGGERIYTLRRWHDTDWPAIILNSVSTTPTKHKQTKGRLDKIRLQVSIFADAPGTADHLAALVRSELDKYSGSVTVVGVVYDIDMITFEDDSDDYDDNQNVYFKRQDYFITQNL